MTESKSLIFRLTQLCLGFVLMLASTALPVSAASATAVLDRTNPGVQKVLESQHRYGPWLMTVTGIVGNATGVVAGEPTLLIFTDRSYVTGSVPGQLGGVSVTRVVTGKLHAVKPPAGKGGGKGGGGQSSQHVDPTTRFARPVPIGISTGNAGECSAGTISARVKDGTGTVYALSNNHVYALENNAPLDSEVLQPGLYDTNCVYDSNNHLGSLYKFSPIDFSGSNVIDAAIAISTTSDLGNATPSDGYGVPNSTIADAVLNQAVQKYGRTTGLTHGQVVGINATVNVGYSSGTAQFVNQIVVYSHHPFLKPGDSGSLLVTDNASANPVGLIFAGDQSGKYGIANPIGPVLQYFNITIDGKK